MHGDSSTSQQVSAARIRRKRKRIPLTCPFPLDGSCDSVSSAIREALRPTAVRGYNWDGANDYEEWVEQCEDTSTESDDSMGWNTTKQTSFCSLPLFLLFHLRRFVLANGRMEASEHTMDVPLEVKVDSHGESQDDNDIISQAYKLVGAILHADEGDKEDEDYEGGHYIALCRHDTSSDKWCLINDEKVTELPQSAALDMLAGRPGALPTGPPMRGTLLVYSKEWARQNDMETLEESFRESLVDLAAEEGTVFLTKKTRAAHSQRPEELVGKRLRIRWAKGKFYAGKVVSYNETNGKHSVEYDDGDIREYTLHKKTIQWEDDVDS